MRRAGSRRALIATAALSLSACTAARYGAFIGAGAVMGGGAGYGQSDSDTPMRDAATGALIGAGVVIVVIGLLAAVDSAAAAAGTAYGKAMTENL